MELDVVSFASEEFDSTLHDRLSEYGYRPRPVARECWLAATEWRDNRPIVLAFGSDATAHESILIALARPGPASLGVFDNRSAQWNPQLLAGCREFVGWPCTATEFALRLERLGLSTPVFVPTVTADAAALAEFANLNLIGRAPAFLAALATIKKLAHRDASVPVMIEGETGTGKELAARAIHYLSVRRDCPFIAVNCGALPDSLIESELFGHERGAFTDAKTAQAGLVAQAQRGTLFLDEVDALSPKGQAALLRFLQDHRYRPLGAERFHQADVRVVAAGNRRLAELVESGTFRQDLYFRLNVIQLNLPSLRDRRGDIVVLAEHFVRRFGALHGLGAKRLAPATLAWLNHYHWPGNVRELENFIHREYLLAEGDEICPRVLFRPSTERRKNLPDRRLGTIDTRTPFADIKARVVGDFERRYLTALLVETNGNVSRAARRAGKERRAFGKLLKKHGIGRERSQPR